MSTRGQGRVSLLALAVLHGALLLGMTEPPRAAAAAAAAPGMTAWIFSLITAICSSDGFAITWP